MAFIKINFRFSIFHHLSSIFNLFIYLKNIRRWTNYKIILLAVTIINTTACRQDMHDQPKLQPLEASDFFKDGRASRSLIEGTVARGHLNNDPHLYQGRVDGELVWTFPFPITKEVLRRGEERYNIFCSPCHDQLGYGRGMIVQRGFRQPPSFHIDRLRNAPAGHLFDVISNGLGAMFDYAERIPVHDRWAIVAYIRVLQLSQNATMDDVPEELRQPLMENNK
ncbi:MAG: c-type cytochrome [bacterium]